MYKRFGLTLGQVQAWLNYGFASENGVSGPRQPLTDKQRAFFEIVERSWNEPPSDELFSAAAEFQEEFYANC